jgi:hypothetical protein
LKLFHGGEREREEIMSGIDASQEKTLLLQRVRCGQCRLPLIQLYEGNLLYTLHHHGEGTTQQLPSYSYRALTDPTPLLACPRCGTILSPAMVTIVLPGTVVTEEGKAVRQPNEQ